MRLLRGVVVATSIADWTWVETKKFKVTATWVKRTRFDRKLIVDFKRMSTAIHP